MISLYMLYFVLLEIHYLKNPREAKKGQQWG